MKISRNKSARPVTPSPAAALDAISRFFNQHITRLERSNLEQSLLTKPERNSSAGEQCSTANRIPPSRVYFEYFAFCD